jgi:hypothetical protein
MRDVGLRVNGVTVKDTPEVYEVKEGRLTVNGRVLPLGRGVILVALLRAGWKGIEGILPLELARKALSLDPRLAFLALQSASPRAI